MSGIGIRCCECWREIDDVQVRSVFVDSRHYCQDCHFNRAVRDTSDRLALDLADEIDYVLGEQTAGERAAEYGMDPSVDEWFGEHR